MLTRLIQWLFDYNKLIYNCDSHIIYIYNIYIWKKLHLASPGVLQIKFISNKLNWFLITIKPTCSINWFNGNICFKVFHVIISIGLIKLISTNYENLHVSLIGLIEIFF